MRRNMAGPTGRKHQREPHFVPHLNMHLPIVLHGVWYYKYRGKLAVKIKEHPGKWLASTVHPLLEM